MISLSERLLKLKSCKSKDALLVGICPSVVVAQRARAKGWDYAQCIADLVEVLSDQGHRVALYPNATRDREIKKNHNNDLPLLDDIEERLSQKSRSNTVVFTGPLNASQIYEVIQCCDLHVTSRFHAMIVALGCGIPVMVIGWSHKYIEVLQQFNQQDLVIDYQQGSMSEILMLLDRLQTTRETRRLQILEKLSNVRASSKEQFDFAESIIRGAV
jgi:polysaccharide pyruvyl transferase WcaK-like protein